MLNSEDNKLLQANTPLGHTLINTHAHDAQLRSWEL